MNEYVCPGGQAFVQNQKRSIHVDMTGLLAKLNRCIAQGPHIVFDTRPSGFGKTWACDMLCAFYDWTVDGPAIFKGLDIAEDPSFDEYRNRYVVIRLDMAELFAHERDYELGASRVQMLCGRELMMNYPDVCIHDYRALALTMEAVYLDYRRSFVVVVDNWDEPLRQARGDKNARRVYAQLLRTLIHNRYTALAYLTGIVSPSMCWNDLFAFGVVESSCMSSNPFGPYRGFGKQQVETLSRCWIRDFEALSSWYGDSRAHGGDSPYAESFSPSSVVLAMADEGYRCRRNLFGRNEPYAEHIDRKVANMPLKLAMLLAGGSVSIDPEDPRRGTEAYLATDNGQLELLVHMGCLSFDAQADTVYIPNKEAYELLEQLIGLSKKPTYPFGDTRWKDYHKDRQRRREKTGV